MTSLASVILHHSLAAFPSHLLTGLLTSAPRLVSPFSTRICNWWDVQVGKDHFGCNEQHCG